MAHLSQFFAVLLFYCPLVYSYIGVNINTLDATAAETYCLNTFNSHLASIHSQSEHDEVYSICNTLDSSVSKYCLIGFSDKTTEGTWLWNDGTSVTYTNWNTNEPNNYNNNEDCGYLYQSVHIAFGGKWFDASCIGVNGNYERQPFVCNDPISCEQNGEIKHINWNELNNANDNSAQIPYSNFNIALNESTLAMTFNVDLEYIGYSSDGDFNTAYNLGTTYVVGFDSFGSTGNKINEPGNCENRLLTSFQNRPFNEWWDYSEHPYLSNELGDDTYLSYPPPSDHWTLSIGHHTCTPINYLGVFSWNDLNQCIDYNGNNLINIVDDGTSITLSGTLYVNLVSPYSMQTDTTMYRTFPLIQQDFSISLSKQINVLSSTGTELFITSIIGIYEDETDGSFELSILTQSADYMKLINPTVIATPFGITTGVSITSTSTTCLSASTYTCGQIFTLSISSDQINCPPADMSGVYDIAFDVECRFNEDVCNTFINDNPSGTLVALSVESNFIDTYCEPEMYSVIFEGDMTFYDDDEFLIDHSMSGDNYVIGQDIIYVEIVVDFPEDGSVDNYYNVFQIDIENVFVCTADDTVDMTQNLDQQNGIGGCLSSNIDADGAYDIIINGVDMNYDANIILTATESNVVRFSFKTFDIGRTKMYVHAQLLLKLTNGARRRLSYRLLSVSDNLENSESQNSNQIRHFVDSTTVSSDESINMFSTKINNKENNSDKASNKWLKYATISSVLSLIGSYFMV